MPAPRADNTFPLKWIAMNHAPVHEVPDTRQINLHNEIETPYWCKLFGVTEAHLTSAVEAVGHIAQDVKDYLEFERDHAAQ